MAIIGTGIIIAGIAAIGGNRLWPPRLARLGGQFF
jgi:hypothetical protein